MFKSLTILGSAALLLTALPAQADQALATKHNCMGCHAIDKPLIGPSYKSVAAKYKGQKGADALLVGKVLKGSSGTWNKPDVLNPGTMPPAVGLSEDDAKKLVAWVLSQ
jgi:cytochrome c